MERVDWHAVAARFAFQPGLTWLNNGAAGSLPRALQQVLSTALTEAAADPGHATLDASHQGPRAQVAALLGAAPGEIVLTENTTMGLAMTLLGFPFEPGDEILTTQHEHPSLCSPLSLLSQRSGVKVVKLALPSPPDSADEIVRFFQRAITPRTRAMCFSHVTGATGLRMPVQELCRLARSYEIFTLVDGAQAAGMLELNLKDLGCDAWAGAGHKWLNGPAGTGILYLRDARYNPWDLVPILSEHAMHLGPAATIADALQRRARLNEPALATLAAAADLQATLGPHAIEERVLHLAHIVEQRAVDLWGPGCLLSPWGRGSAQALSSGIKTFVPARDAQRALDPAWIHGLADRLRHDFNIAVATAVVPAQPHAPGPAAHALRVSTGIYNFPDQIDLLFTALEQLTTRPH